MTKSRHLIIMFALVSLYVISVNADTKQDYYRSFWNPMYHGQRLSYCTIDNHVCGNTIANQYCQMMGYKKADHFLIDHNVGLTNYMSTTKQCKGWRCDGFMLIRCMDTMSHKPAKAYYYRFKEFVFPRFDHYRVAWCYTKGKGCGQGAAHSFCRRMGYLKAKKYKIQEHVSATKAIGNQQLCFGQTCNAFNSITCYR